MFSNLFKSVNPDNLTDNFFKVINKEWMLITAGSKDNFNTMTASWGTTGILWNKRIAVCFIRPVRYTFEFAESNEFYTLSFFNNEYRKVLNYCGSHSGKHTDKIAVTGLTPVETPEGSVTFAESRLVFECRKLYSDYIKEENFIIRSLAELHYPDKDFHKFYIGEIIGCYGKQL